MEGTAIFIFWPTKKKHKNPINDKFKWIDQACVRPGNSTGSSGPLNLVNLRGVTVSGKWLSCAFIFMASMV